MTETLNTVLSRQSSFTKSLLHTLETPLVMNIEMGMTVIDRVASNYLNQKDLDELYSNLESHNRTGYIIDYLSAHGCTMNDLIKGLNSTGVHSYDYCLNSNNQLVFS